MKINLLLAYCCLGVFVASCGSFTRVERDEYTITEVDTIVIEQVYNQPNDRDNGVVYPSSRTVVKDRSLLQRDSTVKREYPAFIRFGAVEAIGTIGSAIDGQSTQAGMFGLFTSIDELLFDQEPDPEASTVFSGSIRRYGIMEWKLPFFNDDPDWTFGLTAYESHKPDNNPDNWLTGVSVLNVRKRFYLSSKIPYMAITPHFSLSMFPSPYASLSASADIGSIGGVNLKAVAGYTMGLTSFSPATNRFVNFAYFGLGVSMFDFLNREEELDVEWKYHEHSAWEISVGDVMFLGANTDNSFWSVEGEEQGTVALTGFAGRLFTATLALPFLDKHFALGTSLTQILVLGRQEFAISVLPIRASYIWNVFDNSFVVEPFFEFNYAPSTFTHLGVRAAMPIAENLSLQFVAAYASGNTGSNFLFDLEDEPIPSTLPDFNAIYFGIGVSVLDRLFGEGELRYGKGYPHE